MPPEPAQWQAQLRQAIEAAYGSVKGYAKFLAGDGATDKQIDARRRGIQKWLEIAKPVVPSVQTVTRLLQDGIQVDPAVFPRGQGRPRPYTTAELGELVEQLLPILQGVSTNTASVLGQVEDATKAIEGLHSEIGSLRDETQRLGNSLQRRRRAS